jgi:hypothetical protein
MRPFLAGNNVVLDNTLLWKQNTDVAAVRAG